MQRLLDDKCVDVTETTGAQVALLPPRQALVVLIFLAPQLGRHDRVETALVRLPAQSP
jgi:hypothetical protein